MTGRAKKRKLIWLAALLLLLGGSQAATAQRLRNGLVVGVTGAQIDGDRMDGYHKLGFVVGGAATLQISNRWSLRPEILFTQKGSRSTAADSLTYLRYRLNYVQIPVLLEYRVIPKLRLQAGISLDYLLGSGVDYGYGYQTPNPAFRKLDVMYTGGVEYALGPRWAANLRFAYSAQNISTIDSAPDNYLFFGRLSLGQRNNLFQATMCYYFTDEAALK